MAANGEPLGADDAAILALESEAIAGHTLKVCVLEPGDGQLDLEALRAGVASRLAREPRGRERVDAGESGSARWVADESFDIRRHVAAVEGTVGLDEDGLRRVAGELMSERLDHRRPLWRLDVVGPLADGREAIVARVHHAMADGIATVRFLSAVLWEAVRDPADGSARRGPRPRRSGPESRSGVRELVGLPGAVRRELGSRAGGSPLDRPIGSERELAFTGTSLAELRRIGAARPGRVTVNDVLLALVAGGLRDWLAADEALPRLRAQVPVSLHRRDAEPDQLGNSDSFLNVDLPLAEPDPLARLDAISAETARRKRLGDPDELYDLFHSLARFRRLHSAAERLAASPHEFAVSVSNVPGPGGPVAVAGRRVERLFTVAEPADHHALRISAISCAGGFGIGLCTDPEALPGVAELSRAIGGSLAELRRATIE